METEKTINSLTYSELSVENKLIVDKVLAQLNGKSIAEIRKVLTAIRQEVDFRGSLNR